MASRNSAQSGETESISPRMASIFGRSNRTPEVDEMDRLVGSQMRQTARAREAFAEMRGYAQELEAENRRLTEENASLREALANERAAQSAAANGHESKTSAEIVKAGRTG